MSISNVFIDQGAEFSITLTINDSAGDPLDLTNYTAAGQLRKTYTSTAKTDFVVTFDADRTTGKVTLSMTNAVTKLITAGQYVYDVVITASDGAKTRVVEGSGTVSPGVTQ
jgi:hypothetical protein